MKMKVIIKPTIQPIKSSRKKHYQKQWDDSIDKLYSHVNHIYNETRETINRKDTLTIEILNETANYFRVKEKEFWITHTVDNEKQSYLIFHLENLSFEL